MISWINKFTHENNVHNLYKNKYFSDYMDEIKMRSKSWNIGDYRTENMKQNIQRARDNIERLIIVMDEIRNFRPLTEEMLENIDKMDEGSKMIILREYNRVLSSVVELL